VVVPAMDPDWAQGMSAREGRKMRLSEWTKRAYWTLVEQWRPVGGELPWSVMARGPEVGALPPPSWR